MDGYGIIYKAKSPSGKVYIGQTIKSLLDRRRKHISVAFRKSNKKTYNTKFYRALRKYNTKMDWEIIYANIPIINLNLLEIWNISKYNSFNNGYNGTLGGQGILTKESILRKKIKLSKSNKGCVPWIKGKKHTEITKNKISIANKGCIPWNKGKKLLEITKAKISENHARHMLGKHHSKETIVKMSGENNIMSKFTWKDVKNIRKLYSSGKYTHKCLGKKYNVCRQTIGQLISNETWKDEDYIPIESTRVKLSIKEAKEIRKMFLGMNYTRKKLSKIYNISLSNIYDIIKNKIWVDENYIIPEPKVTMDIVKAEEIRKIYKTGKYTQKQISDKYNINRSSVSHIINNKIWKNN